MARRPGSSARARHPPSASSSSRRRPRRARRSLRGAGARVLHDLDLTLHGGDRVAVSGANGAGKTTLLSLLLGTLEPSAGEVEVTTSVRLLPQRPHATGPLLPWFRRHRRVARPHAARALRPRRRRGPPPARAPEPRPACARGDRRHRRLRGRPAAPRRADEPPRLRHARGARAGARGLPEHDRRGLPRPLVPRRDRRTRHLHVEAGGVSEGAMLGRHVHLSGHGWSGFPRLSPL